MRIESAQRIMSSGSTRRREPPGGDGFSLAKPGDTQAAAATRGSAAISGIEALMALQEVDDATVRRRKAMKRGHGLLDMLESIKLDLISGIEDAGAISRLHDMVRREKASVEDPGLNDVLEEIELRAAVELAKRGISTV